MSRRYIYTCKTCIHTWIHDSTYLIHTHFAPKENRNVIETLIPLCHNKVLKFKFVPQISKLICYVIIKGVLGLLTLNQDLHTYLFGNVTLFIIIIHDIELLWGFRLNPKLFVSWHFKRLSIGVRNYKMQHSSRGVSVESKVTYPYVLYLELWGAIMLGRCIQHISHPTPTYPHQTPIQWSGSKPYMIEIL